MTVLLGGAEPVVLVELQSLLERHDGSLAEAFVPKWIMIVREKHILGELLGKRRVQQHALHLPQVVHVTLMPEGGVPRV
eukprot:scaffold3038_cov250-Pinguiococcus_pyrenoidosus.AAC.9